MSKIKNDKLFDAIKSHHDLLVNKVLPQSEQFTTQLLEFHQKQSKDFQRIQDEISVVIGDFKKKFLECEENVHQIDTEWEKVRKFANTGKGFLAAKSQQIKSKTKNMDAVATGLKQTVGKIKPMKLAELPVQKQKSLQNLFSTLFAVLYHEKKNTFDWKSFRKLALKHEEGEDFLFRLVNINFKDLKQDEQEMLLILKNDPEFQNACLNSTYAQDIIDLADWIEYVCVGHQFSHEKKEAEKEYEKIRKDMSKKSGGSLEMSKKFWKEALEQIDKFQNNLVSLESEIKTLRIGAQNSIETIKEANQWRNDEIKKINDLLG